MQSTERRWVYFYDFQLKSFPDDAPRFDLEQVLEKVEEVWKNGKAVNNYRNKELTIRLKDLKKTKNEFALLIHVSDIKATDPAFSNIQTGEVRIEPKKSGEGIGAACHVILKRHHISDKKGYYLAIIEEVVGIPKSVIESFLTHLFKISCESFFKRKSSPSKKDIKCRPIAKFAGHASSTLKDSLSKSTLQGITLLNNSDGQFIDDDKELRMTEKSIRLRVTGAPSGNKAIDCSAQLNQDTFLKELCSYSIGDRSPFAV